jgi:hypothetical protein
MKRGWLRLLLRERREAKQLAYDLWHDDNMKWLESLKEEM